MKYLYLVLVMLLSSSGFSQDEDNNKLQEENKIYIEKLKKRIGDVEKIISPENVLIKKLRDSIAFLKSKMIELEQKETNKSEIVPNNKSVTLLFDKGITELNDSVKSEFLKKINNQKIIKKVFIIGYADSTGSKDNNLILSKKRAEKTKQFLQKSNVVNPEYIYINWLGDQVPTCGRKVIVTLYYE